MEISLPNKESQYAEIKVPQESKKTKSIKADIVRQEEEAFSSFLVNIAALASKNDELLSPPFPIPLSSMSLKRDNERSITLAPNLVFHIYTKYINIEHHYIKSKVASSRVDLQYVPLSRIIADRVTKIFTHAQVYLFIKQMCIS